MVSLFASIKNDARRRWKLFAITAIIILALVSSVYAYWKINAPPPPSLYTIATSPPLELRMELDKTEFQLNETIIVRLFLRNIGSEEITLVFHYENYMVGFIVKDENGTSVFEYPSVYLMALKEVVLQSGGQINETLEWRQAYNTPPFTHSPFVSGTYKIIGLTGYHHIKSTEWSISRFETPPITITII